MNEENEGNEGRLVYFSVISHTQSLAKKFVGFFPQKNTHSSPEQTKGKNSWCGKKEIERKIEA